MSATNRPIPYEEIAIPEALGGGWFKIKLRRSFADDLRIEGAGYSVRQGLSQEELAEITDVGDLIELDAGDKVASRIYTALLDASFLRRADGTKITAKQWCLDDDTPPALGRYVLTMIEDFYARSERDKSGEDRAVADPVGDDHEGRDGLPA